MDYYSAGISVFYIAFFEIIAIVWIYGAKHLASNIYKMNGQKPNIYFLVCWYAITPAFIFIIWIFNWYEYKPVKYEDKDFNVGAQVFGWCIALVSIIAIPLGAIHTLYKAPGKSLYEKLLFSIRPSIDDIDEMETSNAVIIENRAGLFKKKNNKVDAEMVQF
mgnify:CR=1 FL=1